MRARAIGQLACDVRALGSTASMRAGAGPSHGHADLTSVWVQRDAAWVFSDPGTGTYNGLLEVKE